MFSPEDDVVGNLPQLLLCGHIFCAACLRSLEVNNVIICPNCKVTLLHQNLSKQQLYYKCTIEYPVAFWLFLSYLMSIHCMFNHAGCRCRSTPLSQRGVWRACRLTAESLASSTLPRWTRRGGEVVLKRCLCYWQLTWSVLLYLALTSVFRLLALGLTDRGYTKSSPRHPSRRTAQRYRRWFPLHRCVTQGDWPMLAARMRLRLRSNGFHQMMCVCV